MVIFNNWSNRRRYFSSVVSVYSCKFINFIYLLSSSKIKTKEIKDSHTLAVSFLLQLMDNKKLLKTFLANQKILFIWSNIIINANASISERLNVTINSAIPLPSHCISKPARQAQKRGGEGGGKCGRKRTWEEGASFLLSPISFPFLSFPVASALSTPATQATLKLKEQGRTRRAKGPNGRTYPDFLSMEKYCYSHLDEILVHRIPI